MKYEWTPAFDADRRRLSASGLVLFRQVVSEFFIEAAERVAADPAARWPRKLRLKPVRGASGVWEMTWSFSGPDGRATFEWIRIDGVPAIRWRRVGGHAIFGEP